jgi:hypothetical protein
MPESEEYIRGMRAAHVFIAQSMFLGIDAETAIELVKTRLEFLSAENAARRMSRIELPDGGGW